MGWDLLGERGAHPKCNTNSFSHAFSYIFLVFFLLLFLSLGLFSVGPPLSERRWRLRIEYKWNSIRETMSTTQLEYQKNGVFILGRTEFTRSANTIYKLSQTVNITNLINAAGLHKHTVGRSRKRKQTQLCFSVSLLQLSYSSEYSWMTAKRQSDINEITVIKQQHQSSLHFPVSSKHWPNICLQDGRHFFSWCVCGYGTISLDALWWHRSAVQNVSKKAPSNKLQVIKKIK